MTIAVPDPAGRSGLLAAAFELFAEHGVDRVSVRAIAARAGVTAGLVTHHFGAKQALIAEVDGYALDLCVGVLEEALAQLDDEAASTPRAPAPAPASPIDRVQQTISDAMRDQPLLRGYIARRIVSDAEAGQAFFQQFVRLVEAGLRRLREAGAVRPEVDHVGAMVMVVHLILAPIVFGRQWSHLAGLDAFDPRIIGPATLANQEILMRGLFVPDGTDAEPADRPNM